MKYLVIILALLASGCSQLIYAHYDDVFTDRYRVAPMTTSFRSVESTEDIPMWIRFYLHYNIDYFYKPLRNPDDVLRSGEGNCEDKAIVYLAILHNQFGIKGELCLIDYTIFAGRHVAAGGNSNHAVVRYNGMLIEPSTGEILNNEVMYSYTYDEIFCE